MDWDRKFSSIVAETEANLAKAKQKLKVSSASHWNNRWTSEKYPSAYEQNFPSAMDWPLCSARLAQPLGAGYSDLGERMPLARDPLALHSTPLPPGYQGVMEEQNKTIGGLSKLVRDLEDERNSYQRQINDLKREMTQISNQLLEQKRGSRVEHQLERLKQEVSQEVQGLRGALESSLHHSQCVSFTPNPNLSFRDLMDVKEDVHDEMAYIKRELASLRRRIENVECDVSRHSFGGRERAHLYPSPKDNRLNRSLYEGTSRPLRSLLTPPSLLSRSLLSPPSLPGSSLDRQQLDHIRSTVGTMKSKLDELDLRLSFLPQSQPTLNGFSQKHRETGRTTPPLDLDDLSLTDFEDDFQDDLTPALSDEILSSRYAYHLQKAEADEEDEDEEEDVSDLDLDDLDLSNDDDDNDDDGGDGIRNVYAHDYDADDDLGDEDAKDGGDANLGDDLSLDSADLADVDDL